LGGGGLGNGESTALAPKEFPLREMALGRDAAFAKQAGLVHVARIELEVLVVRPQVGVWRGRVRDGNERDSEHQSNRGVSVSLAELESNIEAENLPLKTGDVVIAIDPVRMDLLRLELQ
jgi:hypothetical protein